MNVRIIINIALCACCLLAAAWLQLHGLLFIPSRSVPGRGLLFEGASLYLLVLGLLATAAYAGAVARAWLRGDIPLPAPGTIRPDPAYRGRILVRYWYLLACIALGLGGALVLARRTSPGAVPAPAPHVPRTSSTHP